MKEGDVVLTPLPQADGQVKNRPTLALRQMPRFGDWLVCGISTQMQQRVVDFDELIERAEEDFAASGLKATSLIRLGFLAVLPSSRFLGVLGSVSQARHSRLLQKLCKYLSSDR